MLGHSSPGDSRRVLLMSSLPDIDKELTDFFTWRPASFRLYLSPTTSESKASRDPPFYDKLLAEHLILRKVRHLPSLPMDIAGTVDDALKTISDNGKALPPLSAGFPIRSFRSFFENARPLVMQNEMSMAEFYGHTTAPFCQTVASTLALLSFLPSLPDWQNILYWTVSPSKTGYAIADGSLQIILKKVDSPDDAKTETEKLLYESGFGSLLQRIRRVLGDLAVWEFKSLSVGDHPTMMGIRNEAFTGIPFRWETIDNDEYGRIGRRYDTPPSGRPDAKVTPWTLPSDSDDNPESPSEQGHRQTALHPLPGVVSSEIQPAQHPAPIAWSRFSSPLSSVPSDDSEPAEQEHRQIVQPSQGEASTPTSMRGRSRGGARGRSRGRGRGRGRSVGRGVATQYGSRPNKKRKLDNDNENYKSKQELSAASFIQQVRSSL